MTARTPRPAGRHAADVLTTAAAYLSTGIAIAVAVIARRWWRS